MLKALLTTFSKHAVFFIFLKHRKLVNCVLLFNCGVSVFDFNDFLKYSMVAEQSICEQTQPYLLLRIR
jgi:hypothetical protein